MASDTDHDDGFPPRGSGAKGAGERPPDEAWGHPWELGASWDWHVGKVVLGRWGERFLAEPDQPHAPRKGDDRHLQTFAGSRGGKSSTVLIPNLLTYPGSMMVIDPKGELALATARHRRDKLGHQVAVIDPFGTTVDEKGSVPEDLRKSYNPLDELSPERDTFIDDIALVADALIIEPPKGDPHWTDASKNLLKGLMLYLYASGGAVTLPRLRRVLLGEEGSLAIPEKPEQAKAKDYLFVRMAEMDAFDGLLSLIGTSLLEKNEKEFESILSTAREQTAFLDSVPLSRVLGSSEVRINRIKDVPTTIYLCLPATRLPTHSRWLRTIVNVALVEMERDRRKPRYPVLMILEEFAALGHMRSIERAASFMAGFGVRLWSVLQDLSQLKEHYPASWETFVGNAGVVQAFADVDISTTEYLSKMMGNTRVLDVQYAHVSSAGLAHGDLGARPNMISVPLLAPSEIPRFFSRESGRQLILVPGRPPIYMERLPHNG